MNYIRKATIRDVSRIAEILIFTKRMNYRSIFQNDQVSFGEMQVLPLAEEFLREPDRLKDYWVYDDGFPKGLIHVSGKELAKLYVDSFFHGEGIGGKLMEFALEQKGIDFLWVLEKNARAIEFYRRHGMVMTGERRLQEGTLEYVVKMERNFGGSA